MHGAGGFGAVPENNHVGVTLNIIFQGWIQRGYGGGGGGGGGGGQPKSRFYA